MLKQPYRTRSDIVEKVLDVIMNGGQNGVVISKITTKANLAYYSVLERCDNLENAGLIVKVKNGRKKLYVITEKGIKFFQEFQRFQNLVRSMNLEL